MNRRIKMTAKCISNRQRVKVQAKEIKKLRNACNVHEIRVEHWKNIAIGEQRRCNGKDNEIQRLMTQNKQIEEKVTKLQEKKSFWKRVIG